MAVLSLIDERLIQLLARKLSGETSPGEKEELDELLMRDPEAVFYAELITQLWQEGRLRQLTARQIADTDMAYLKHLALYRPEFRRTTASEAAPTSSGMPLRPANLFRSAKRLRLAACIVLAALTLCLYQWKYGHNQPPHRSPRTEENTAIFAQLGTRRTIVLPDGTRVWLNAGSRLSYDSNMLRKELREVTLSGEAFFDVAKDKDRCFLIHTDKIAIRVLGTAFNVRAYPHDKITETTLMGGSVELTVNNKPYQKIILKPKEKFALIDDPQEEIAPAKHSPLRSARSTIKEKLIVQEVVPVEVDDKEYVREVSWVENNFVFQNETLEELAPNMERWFNVTIEINKPETGGFHFTGIFHKETIDQALQAMKLIKPFKFTIINNHVFIN